MTKEEFLTLFFEWANENKIDYFVFGSYQFLPRDTGGSDIDIVVTESDFFKIERTILDLSMKNGIALASYYETYNAKFYRFLTFEWGVQIDIFYKGLLYRGASYFPVDLLQNDVFVYNNIVRVLNVEKGYFVDYFKEIIHNGRAKEKYTKAILNAFNKDFDKTKDLVERVYGKKTLDLILENLSIDGLNKIAIPLQKELRKMVSRRNKIKQWLVKISLMKRFFMRKPGYVIVVEGTDGSGKSTVISKITPILNECFHNGVVYNHLRPNWLPDIAVVLGKRKKPKEGQEVKVVSDPHSGKQSGFAMSLVRWGWYMLDYTLGFLKKVWLPIHSKSKVFIFDRYYYEFYLDQKRSHVKLPNWVVRVGEFFLPKPDLILCLGGDPEKIYARKPETSLEEVQRQTAVLKDFCKKRKNAVWIDTTVKPEESIEAAMLAITAMMSKRFKIDDVR